jgi:hypothetical protein
LRSTGLKKPLEFRRGIFPSASESLNISPQNALTQGFHFKGDETEAREGGDLPEVLQQAGGMSHS